MPPKEPSCQSQNLCCFYTERAWNKVRRFPLPFRPPGECVNVFLLEPFTGGQEKSCELNQAHFMLITWEQGSRRWAIMDN